MKKHFVPITIPIMAFVTIILIQGCKNSPEEAPVVTEEASTESDSTLIEEEPTEVLPDKEASEKPAEKKVAPEDEKLKKQKPLTITMTDLKSPTAPIIFSIYVDAGTFLEPKAQLKTYRFVPKGNSIKMKLKGLKFGTYAIAFYQDLNNNGQLDKNPLGIPKEPYAFSNDIRPKLKAPTFNDCKFDYSATENTIAVKMGK